LQWAPSGKIDTAFTGAAPQIEQRLAVDVSEMSEDETILRRGARSVIADPNAIDVDGFGPAIMKINSL
jgi:hypothetical protein